MTKVDAHHLTEKQLLQFLDNELSFWTRLTALWHLKSCWECRRQLDELHSSVFDYLRFEQRLAALDSRESHGAWPDLRGRMAQIQRETIGAGPFQQLRRGTRFSYPSWLIRSTVGLGVLTSLYAAYVWIDGASHAVPVAVKTSRSVGTKAPEPAAPSQELLPSKHAKQPDSIGPSRNEARVRPEVAAVAALHRIDADLGEPIEIRVSSGDRIEIVAKGLGREREAELESEFEGIPAVTLHFQQPSIGASGPGGIHHSLSFAAGHIPFESDLSRLLGGTTEIRGLANEALDESDAMIARAYALRDLAVRFPPGRRRELNQSDDAIVSQIESDHREALRLHIRGLRDTLAPVLPGLYGARNSSAAAASGAGLFESAQRLDRAVMIVFGGADTTMSFQQAMSELSLAWKQLNLTLEPGY